MSLEHSEIELSEEERALQAEVEKSEHALQALNLELREVDGELEALAARSHQYELLEKICCSLEELESLDAAHLFWGEQARPDATAERLSVARGQASQFDAEVARVEDRRASLVDRINAQNDSLDLLHYDLRDAIEREELRKSEWLVEHEPLEVAYRPQVMPWSRGVEEDYRFRKSLGTALAASLALAFLVSTVALPIINRSTLNELPERVAKIVREERALPPPPPPVEELPVPDEDIREPDPEVVEEPPPEDLPESVAEPMLAEAAPVDTREQVKSRGILAFRESFATAASLRPAAQLGSQAKVRNAGEDAVGRPERMMVATNAPGSSGGINLADVSRDVGGGGPGLQGVQIGRVASSIGGAEGPARPLSGGAAAGRTDEEIQIVFDRYKAALYRLYNRELRKDPTLRGQLVLRLTIEPDGSVSLCQLHSSDMDAPELAGQVVERVLTFDFGAKEDIVAMTIIYPIDFLPSA